MREAIMILLLSPHVGGETEAFLAIGYRIVTTLGNLFFALIGLAMAHVSGRWNVLLFGKNEPMAQ
jgi:uncharacterized membrane protein YbhN (UPF0104 family)